MLVEPQSALQATVFISVALFMQVHLDYQQLVAAVLEI